MDESTYTTKDIAAIFKVSHQAVKTWARQFADYLSPTARPEEGKRRIFTDADMRVFALVRERTQRGDNFKDVHYALKSGQRGDVPAIAAQIVAGSPQQVELLDQEIQILRERIKTLETDRDMALGQVKLLEKQLAEKEQLIRQLYQDNARLEAERNPKHD